VTPAVARQVTMLALESTRRGAKTESIVIWYAHSPSRSTTIHSDRWRMD